MAVPVILTDISATAASNSPTGSEAVGTSLDDYLRGIQASIRGGLANKGADIASASTTDLGAVAGYMHDITGTTTITSFGTVSAGIPKVVKFEGVLTLTHNATSLILPGASNITTADGDIGLFISEGSGNWRCISFFPVGGSLPFSDAAPVVVGSSDATKKVRFEVDGLTTATTRVLTVQDFDMTLGPVLGTPTATTSGTSVDVTSIPAWVKEIAIQFAGVSTSGTSNPLVQIGDSGGIEASGYLGASALLPDSSGIVAANYTTGFGIASASAGAVLHGTITLRLQNSSTNTWVASGALSNSSSAACFVSSGTKSLSAALDRIRLTTVGGSDTFDAGAITVLLS